MNKMKLLGMATELYHADNEWEGADIHVLMEIEETKQTIDGRLHIGENYLTLIQVYGYKDVENFIIKRVENCLNKVQKEFDVENKDINTIYEVVRLKMQRFIHKSALRIAYRWNAVTGDIYEE